MMAETNQKTQRESKNIQVFIRIRPSSQIETNFSKCVIPLDQHQISMREKDSGVDPQVFHFDRIFPESSTQEEVFTTVGQEIIKNAFDGINGTIFCYGQTSSGKTYTCIGPNFNQQYKRGILPRTIEQIQLKIEESPKHIECKMKISMIEIYNEKIKDLLDQTKNDLKIRSNKSQGIFLEGVTEKYILSQDQSFFYIAKGIENRSVSFTTMNSLSSRSHMVVTLTLHQHDFYTGEARIAKITLVDLAGSEKISRTGAEGKLLEEAKKINTSLSVLGKVINTLSEGKKSHVPYRDSKLTRLLQESLGGNSITNLIINVSPSVINEHETLSSLRFGFRAKAIKNEPRVNKEYTVSELLELLSNAEKKIKDQNQLITILMKEKGYDSISIEEFMSFYIFRNSERQANLDSEEENFSPGLSFGKDISPTKSTWSRDKHHARNLAHCGSEPSLGVGFRFQDKLPKVQETQDSPAQNQLSLLNLNKSQGYLGKKFFTPKHSESKNLFPTPKKSFTLNIPSDEEEMLLDDYEPIERLSFNLQKGKSEDGQLETRQACSLQFQTFDIKVEFEKKGLLDLLDDESNHLHGEPSGETECKSEESRECEKKKYLDKIKMQGGSVHEKLEQIRLNLEKIRMMKKPKRLG